jgi:hypothetical protein
MAMPLSISRLSAWSRYALLTAAVAVVAFAAIGWRWPWQPGRIGGLVFGTMAALLFVNAALYPWRRRWSARPWGTAQRWLKLHVYGSSLAFLCVLIHTGFRWPAGTMGWLLLLLSFWATATGVLGVWLQTTVPRTMARRLTVEAIYERIPELMAALVAEADALMTASPDALARVYTGEIRPALATARPSVRWVTGFDPSAARSAALIERMRQFAGAADRSRLDDLESIMKDKIDLDAQISLQQLLRGWLVLHVPPAILLIGLIAVHIFAVVWH